MTPEIITIQPARVPNAVRMPLWIRQNLGGDAHYGKTNDAVQTNRLHTVCEEARCPNRGECWSRGTATFMLLGDTCTRACGFCSVKTGKPAWFDADEPRRVAEAVMALRLQYIVLTSVNRDDLPDGGAGISCRNLEATALARCADRRGISDPRISAPVRTRLSPPSSTHWRICPQARAATWCGDTTWKPYRACIKQHARVRNMHARSHC